ncbi:unnamed protein product, partial [Ilex paraguariensis]
RLFSEPLTLVREGEVDSFNGAQPKQGQGESDGVKDSSEGEADSEGGERDEDENEVTGRTRLWI